MISKWHTWNCFSKSESKERAAVNPYHWHWQAIDILESRDGGPNLQLCGNAILFIYYLSKTLLGPGGSSGPFFLKGTPWPELSQRLLWGPITLMRTAQDPEASDLNEPEPEWLVIKIAAQVNMVFDSSHNHIKITTKLRNNHHQKQLKSSWMEVLQLGI